MQLAAVRLDAGTEGLPVQWPEFIVDGVHGVCDGGAPTNSSPAPARCSGSVAAVEGAAVRRASRHDPPAPRHHHGLSSPDQAVRQVGAAVLTRGAARLVGIALLARQWGCSPACAFSRADSRTRPASVGGSALSQNP